MDLCNGVCVLFGQFRFFLLEQDLVVVIFDLVHQLEFCDLEKVFSSLPASLEHLDAVVSFEGILERLADDEFRGVALHQFVVRFRLPPCKCELRVSQALGRFVCRMPGVDFLYFGCDLRAVCQAYINKFLDGEFLVVIGLDRGK